MWIFSRCASHIMGGSVLILWSSGVFLVLYNKYEFTDVEDADNGAGDNDDAADDDGGEGAADAEEQQEEGGEEEEGQAPEADEGETWARQETQTSEEANRARTRATNEQVRNEHERQRR